MSGPYGERAVPASRSARPVLIVGTERSGSNLLRLVLNSHSQLAVPHPPHFMRFLAPIAGSYGDLAIGDNKRRLIRDALLLLRHHIHPWPHDIEEERVWRESTPSLFGVVAAIYEQYRLAEGKARWGCKSTFMIHHVAEVLAEYPDARFLWLVRDPRDVATSSKTSVFNPCHPYLTGRLWHDQQVTGFDEMRLRGPGVVHLVRYEDLVTAPEPTIRGVCNFIGVPFEPGTLAHHRTLEARHTANLSESWRNAGRPISPRSVGRHAGGLRPAEREWVDAAAYPVAGQLGYASGVTAVRPPATALISLRDRAMRAKVELRSMRHDRNYRRRMVRDATVWWLRAKARTNPAHRRTAPDDPGVPDRSGPRGMGGHG